MPWHQAEDAAREAAAGDAGIGTTKRGIGPCYADKMHRTTAVRVADLTGDAGAAAGADHPHRRRPQHGLRRPVRGRRRWTPLSHRRASSSISGRRLAPFVDRHEPPADRGDAGRQADRLRGGPRGHAGRGPRDLPVRDQQQLLGPGACSRGPACRRQAVRNIRRRDQGLQHPRRRRPVPDRAGRTRSATASASGATSTGPPPAGPGGSAGSTRRPSGTPSICAASTIVAVTLLDVLGGLAETPASARATRVGGKPLPSYRADLQVAGQRAEPVYETLGGWEQDVSTCRTLRRPAGGGPGVRGAAGVAVRGPGANGQRGTGAVGDADALSPSPRQSAF